jgi:hypothetical protein
MGIVSKAIQGVELAGIPQEWVTTAAAPLAFSSALVVAALGWRGKTNYYEAWEGVVIVLIPFFVVLGYVPQFVDVVSGVEGAMVVYNWLTWIATSTVIWILSKGN